MSNLTRHWPWLLLAAIAAAIANSPLIVILLWYGDVDWDDRRLLMGLAPNQFLFLLFFFTPAAFLATYAGALLRLFAREAAEAKEGTLRSIRSWKWWFRHQWLVGAVGLAFGLLVAWADDVNTAPAWYGLVPSVEEHEPEIYTAEKAAADYRWIERYLSLWEEPARAKVRSAVVGGLTWEQVSKDVNLEADAGAVDSRAEPHRNRDSFDKARKARDQLRSALKLPSSREYQLLRWTNFAELTAVIFVAWHIVMWTAHLVILRFGIYKDPGLPMELYKCGAYLIFSVCLFLPFIGWRIHALAEVRYVVGQKPPDIGGPLYAGFVVVNLLLLFVVFFAKGRVVKLLTDIVPVLLGVATALGAILVPEIIRNHFGANASWPQLLIWAVIYAVFLAVWTIVVISRTGTPHHANTGIGAASDMPRAKRRSRR